MRLFAAINLNWCLLLLLVYIRNFPDFTVHWTPNRTVEWMRGFRRDHVIPYPLCNLSNQIAWQLQTFLTALSEFVELLHRVWLPYPFVSL